MGDVGDFYQCIGFYQFVLNVEVCWFIVGEEFGIDFVNCGVICLVGDKDVVESYICYIFVCCFDNVFDGFQYVVGLCFWVVDVYYIVLFIKWQGV